MTIADARCAWLTTVRHDGSPHTTPVWFLFRDEIFWVASSTVNLKVANMLRDPRVSLAVDGSSSAPSVAQGNAVVHDPILGRDDLLQAFADKYDGWDAADPDQDGPRVLVEIPVGRWLMRTEVT